MLSGANADKIVSSLAICGSLETGVDLTRSKLVWTSLDRNLGCADGGVGGSGLSGGAIAGIVLGVVAALLLLAAAVIMLMKCRHRPNQILPAGCGLS